MTLFLLRKNAGCLKINTSEYFGNSIKRLTFVDRIININLKPIFEMKKLIMTFAACCVLAGCGQKAAHENPFMSEFQSPYGAPDFDKITDADYLPAFEAGIKQQNEEIKSIVDNKEEPTFENTVVAFDNTGEILSRVSHVFFALTEADTNDEIKRIAGEISPKLSSHEDNIYLDDALFKRFKKVYDMYQNKEIELTTEQFRLLDKYYKSFVRAGALLGAEQKDRLRKINQELSSLTLKFRDNVLADGNAYQLVIDKEEDLSGLPEGVRTAAAHLAKELGMEGKWVFTLGGSSRIPFLQYADNRDLRRQIYEAYINKGNNDNEYDNKEVLKQILTLRLEKARLLGFDCYSDFVLDVNMAKNKETVMEFLGKLWPYSLQKAKDERAALQAMMDREGKGEKLEAWDWWYYTSKLRKEKFDLDESEVRPYFSLENVRKGLFYCANKMYGIKLTKVDNVPVYVPGEVDVFKVEDADGSFLGLLYTDYVPRPGKRGGAWMEIFREQDCDIRPLVYNVASFTKPVGDKPALLSAGEVETMFHEFGHGLHGLLTQCNYKGVAGTNVAHDFVELPSQFNEHWAMEPEVLAVYAKHYKTGETIPQELVDKMMSQGSFNQGFEVTERLAACYLDMAMHNLTTTEGLDIARLEAETLKEIGLIPEIAPRYRSTFYNHIMGGYAAGYYGYLWSEQLDADAFSVFKKNGIFDKETCQKFRKNILERGGTDDAMQLYINFRGQKPSIEGLLDARGLK